MTKEKTDSIIDKIKKLMALGESSNEHEASLAMQRVQEILASYNLTMAEVESHKGKDAGNGDVNANRKKDTLEKSAMYNYQRLLMKRVADVHYCLHFVYEKRTWNSKTNRDKVLKYHVLIGREANVVTAKLMFDYLNSTIEKLAKEVYPYPANLSRSAISWKEGCSSRLQERLRERKLEADRAQEEKAAEYRKTHTNGTSLMLLTDIRQAEEDLNHDFLYGDDAGTRAARRAKWEADWAAAREAEKNKPAVPQKEKTEKEKQKEEREWKKWQEKQERKSRRYWAGKDIDAYYSGREKGESIGLDTQVSKSNTKSIN